jgi:predicted kinase
MSTIKPVNGAYDVPFSGKAEATAVTGVPLVTKRKSKMIILCGCSGSGKTTWASEMLSTNPNTVRVNRDLARQQLFGYTEETIQSYYNHPSLRQREDTVTVFETLTIRGALDQGLDVLIDNTNLNPAYIQRYLSSFPYTEITLKLMDVPMETCIARDKERISPVGEDLIQPLQLLRIRVCLRHTYLISMGHLLTVVGEIHLIGSKLSVIQ